MSFALTPNVEVEDDDKGIVRHLRHIHEPFQSSSGPPSSARQLADEYVRAVAAHYRVPDESLAQLALLLPKVQETFTEDASRLRFVEEKSILGSTIVSYAQTTLGLPIWEAGLSVTLLDHPLRVTSSQSSFRHDVDVSAPSPKARFTPAHLDDERLQHALFGRKDPKHEGAGPATTRKRLLVYRYAPIDRYDAESAERRADGIPLQSQPPTLPLPPVSDSIRPGRHYVVTEVLFDYEVKLLGKLHWRAFVEVETGSVLYLRAFVACATGAVYTTDPLTQSGNPTITPASATAQLDAFRATVPLAGLTPPAIPGAPWALRGDFIQIKDTSPPTIPAPTSPTGNFLFDATTDNFSAVNAYFHCDGWFRRMQSLGFNIATFYDGTTANPGFPIPVDHRALGNVVNAQGLGNSLGDGSGGFLFALEQIGAPVGIACDSRVVSHEFCHALLWDSVHSPNFGFSHSAGDSLGIILNDPGSKAPDRFLTFPWVTAVPRRSDRPVSTGWAWGGVNDGGGYDSEQILSTTLFRVYRTLGGDSKDAAGHHRVTEQTFASRYMIYTIIRGIGSLATSPITPSPKPNVFTTAMMNADLGTSTFHFDGHTVVGGSITKVIRWGFEKQGLFQPPGAPTPVVSEGAPPNVDVYIDDGRAGEYPPIEHFWESLEVWNRHHADGGTQHQIPKVGARNHAYVRVKNRGTKPAPHLVVRGYHCPPTAGLVWPDDFSAMTTSQLSVAPALLAGHATIVGPFEWTPTTHHHETMLFSASAAGDPSNIDPAIFAPTAGGPQPAWWLVPFDNNIAQRSVAPVAGGGGGSDLFASLHGQRFIAANPTRSTALCTLESILPPFLKTRGWNVGFHGGASFSLPPRGRKEVELVVHRGSDFHPSDVPITPTQAMIRIEALVNQIMVGGVSYLVDPSLTHEPEERPHRKKKRHNGTAVLSGATLRRLVIEIDTGRDDDDDDDE